MIFGGIDMEEIVGSVGIMGAMAISLDVGTCKLRNHSGYCRSRLRSMGSAMMGHCLH